MLDTGLFNPCILYSKLSTSTKQLSVKFSFEHCRRNSQGSHKYQGRVLESEKVDTPLLILQYVLLSEGKLYVRKTFTRLNALLPKRINHGTHAKHFTPRTNESLLPKSLSDRVTLVHTPPACVFPRTWKENPSKFPRSRFGELRDNEPPNRRKC